MHISNITAKWMQCPFSGVLYVVIQVDDLNGSTFASADVDGQRVYWKPQMTNTSQNNSSNNDESKGTNFLFLFAFNIFITCVPSACIFVTNEEKLSIFKAIH